jgi:hypothetical protein
MAPLPASETVQDDEGNVPIARGKQACEPAKNVKDMASGKNNNKNKATVKKSPSQPSAAHIVNHLSEPQLRSDPSCVPMPPQQVGLQLELYGHMQGT